MSHFTVLVPAKDEEDLEGKLTPYYEYGCSNYMDAKVKPYLEFEDVEAEYREKYDTETVERVKMPGGELVEPWDERFRVPGQIGIGNRTHEVPEHLEKVEVPVKQLYATFDEFIEEYAGYKLNPILGKYGHWHNPNAKWDWYSVGGRWTGLFRLKPGKQGENGRPGIMTPENTDASKCDVALAGDVDWFAMEESTIQFKIAQYRERQRFLKLADELKNPPAQVNQKALELFEDKTPRGEKAREIFKTLERCLQWEYAEYLARQDDKQNFWFDDWKDIQKFLMTEEEFTQTTLSVAQTFAFIDLEGNWNQRAEMGWFGCSDEAKGTQDYDVVWWEFVKGLPADQRVYAVDCHI